MAIKHVEEKSKFENMSLTLKNRKYTAEEYFLVEETEDLRHEFINGNLLEMRGASCI